MRTIMVVRVVFIVLLNCEAYECFVGFYDL